MKGRRKGRGQEGRSRRPRGWGRGKREGGGVRSGARQEGEAYSGFEL